MLAMCIKAFLSTFAYFDDILYSDIFGHYLFKKLKNLKCILLFGISEVFLYCKNNKENCFPTK